MSKIGFGVHGLLAAVVGMLGASVTTAAEPTKMTDDALRIHKEAFVIDGHNNLIMKFAKQSSSAIDAADLTKSQPNLHTDLPRLKQGGVGAEIFATYVSSDAVKKGTAVKQTLEQIEQLGKLLSRSQGQIEFALNTSDLQRIHNSGHVAALVAIEGGNSIESSVAVLKTYYQAGVRMMALTHDDTTEWADAALDVAKHGGLAPFGEKVVAEMNQLGMAIDLSHCSNDTISDVLAISKAPVVFSHSGAHAVAPHARNLKDETLKAVAKNGGVVLVNFYAGFLSAESVKAYETRTKDAALFRKQFKTDAEFQAALGPWLKDHPLPSTSVNNVVDHIDHIVKTAGIDHVGLGSNFDGIVSVPKQLEDVSCFPHVTQELLNRGYKEDAIKKILGGNTLRVLKEIETTASSNSSSQTARLIPIGAR